MIVQDVDKEEEKILSALGIEVGGMGENSNVGKASESDRLLGDGSDRSNDTMGDDRKEAGEMVRNPLSAGSLDGEGVEEKGALGPVESGFEEWEEEGDEEEGGGTGRMTGEHKFKKVDIY
jgi:hypothetical protein